MARNITRITSILILQHFGMPAQRITDCVIKRGLASLQEVVEDSGLERQEVKRTLCVLIRHEIIDFRDETSHTLFTVNLHRAYLIARYPRFLSIIKDEFESCAELIISELLIHGHCTIEELVEYITARENPAQSLDLESLQGTFVNLVDRRYVSKVKPPSELIEDLESEIIEGRGGKSVPGGIKRALITAEVTESKRKKLEVSRAKFAENKGDSDLQDVWCINFEHFHEKLRDKLISQYIAVIYTPQLAAVLNTFHAILELDPDTSIKQFQSKEVYIPQIVPQVDLSRGEVERGLALVSREENSLLTKTTESGGGAYVLEYRNCYQLLLRNTVESIIEERYGSKALRIIKNLIRKKYLELSQMSELTLIPPQELNEIVSRLFRESIISVQEVPRLEEYIPGKTFYLYSFDIEKVRRILLNNAFQIIGNMVVKRRSVYEEAERVLKKDDRVCELLGEMKETANTEQLEEIEQLLTPGERQNARNSRMMLERLELAELFIDETIFILSHFHTFP